MPTTLSMRSPSSSGASVRHRHSLPIADPRTDAGAHSAYYALLPAVTGWAMEQVTRAYPDVDRHFLSRMLELALVVGYEVPWMVFSHEGGHYRAARNAGWNPRIEMTGWASGLTWYNVPAGAETTAEQFTVAGAAGVNQEVLNGMHMMRQWALNGGTRVHEAVAMLLAQTNLAAYATRSAIIGENAPSYDDIAGYVDDLRRSGQDISMPRLAGMAIAADLLSAPFWAALIGGVRFVTHGDRVVPYPSIPAGQWDIALPSFQVLLTSRGPVVGGRTFASTEVGGSRVSVELSGDARTDGSGGAIGLGINGIPLGTPRVQLSPYVRGTIDHGRPGVAAGADLHLSITDTIGVSAGASYRSGDLLAEPMGQRDGFEGHAALTLSF